MKISLHACLLHRAETSSGKEQKHPSDPTLNSQRMLCFPRGDARAKRLSIYAGFSHRAANPRLRQAARGDKRTDSDFTKNAVLSKRGCGGQRRFHSMRVYYSVMWRLAPASGGNIPQTRL